jgi:hypothetical protein
MKKAIEIVPSGQLYDENEESFDFIIETVIAA